MNNENVIANIVFFTLMFNIVFMLHEIRDLLKEMQK